MFVEFEQRRNVDIPYTVAIREHELIFPDVFCNPLHSTAGHGIQAGVRERDPEVLLLVIVPVFDPGIAAEADGEVIVHRLVVQEVFLDHVAAVAEAKHEIAEPAVRVNLHDVPQDGTAPDFDHRFGAKLSFLAQPGTKPAAQNDHLHRVLPHILGHMKLLMGLASTLLAGPSRHRRKHGHHYSRTSAFASTPKYHGGPKPRQYYLPATQ